MYKFIASLLAVAMVLSLGVTSVSAYTLTIPTTINRTSVVSSATALEIPSVVRENVAGPGEPDSFIFTVNLTDLIEDIKIEIFGPDGLLFEKAEFKVATGENYFQFLPVYFDKVFEPNTTYTYLITANREVTREEAIFRDKFTTSNFSSAPRMMTPDGIINAKNGSFDLSEDGPVTGLGEDFETAIEVAKSTREIVIQSRLRAINYQTNNRERITVNDARRRFTAHNDVLTQRLKGRILLQVEGDGQAWYVDPETEKKFYLNNGETAFAALNAFGLGITEEDLASIPVGINSSFQLEDSDGDGLADRLWMSYLLDVISDIHRTGRASIEDVDTAMELGCNHPTGPFKWIDENGATSVLVRVMRVLSDLNISTDEEDIAAGFKILDTLSTLEDSFYVEGVGNDKLFESLTVAV